MVTIEGRCISVIYEADNSSFKVFELYSSNGNEVVVKGNFDNIYPGVNYSVVGDWYYNRKYEEDQFKAIRCVEVLPHTEDGILRFLERSNISGIGPVTARKLVDAFGVDTLNVIRDTPERLVEVEGIADRKRNLISNSMRKRYPNKLENDTIVALESLGWHDSDAKKIYEKYGLQSVDEVRKNPYAIISTVSKIGFKKADAVARKYLDFAPNDERRIEACVLYVLRNIVGSKGDTACSYRDLGNNLLSILDLWSNDHSVVDGYVSDIKSVLMKMIDNDYLKQTCVDGNYFFSLPEYYNAEKFAAESLCAMVKNKQFHFDIKDDITKLILDATPNIKLAKGQMDAIAMCLKNHVSVITGGPGVGKTTIIKTLVYIFRDALNLDVALAAPTGRAAKRMTEVIGSEAKTIHRLLEFGHDSSSQVFRFLRDKDNPIEEDVIIIDEASMLDSILLSDLMRAVPINKILIFVGDVDQLPSVGVGNVLSDIIESGVIPVSRLTDIFRVESHKNSSCGEPKLIENAYKINRGEALTKQDFEGANDFFFVEKNSPHEIASQIVYIASHFNEIAPSYLKGIDVFNDMQIITPPRNMKWENIRPLRVAELNHSLQEALNPCTKWDPVMAKKDVQFRVGDKVMQTENDYHKEWYDPTSYDNGYGVFNGDIGIIVNIEDNVMTVDMNGKYYDYIQEDLDNLELCYATTVHKSQGGECDVIIVPLWNFGKNLMTRNLLYTAVTRAKKCVIMVGKLDYANTMIHNICSSKRVTLFKYSLVNAYK